MHTCYGAHYLFVHLARPPHRDPPIHSNQKLFMPELGFVSPPMTTRACWSAPQPIISERNGVLGFLPERRLHRDWTVHELLLNRSVHDRMTAQGNTVGEQPSGSGRFAGKLGLVRDCGGQNVRRIPTAGLVCHRRAVPAQRQRSFGNWSRHSVRSIRSRRV